MKEVISIPKTVGVVAIIGALSTGVLYIGSKADATEVNHGLSKVEMSAKKDCLEIRKDLKGQIRQLDKKLTGFRTEIRIDLREVRKDLRAIIRGQK